MSKSPPSAGPALIACSLCGTAVDTGHARQRQIVTEDGPHLAWICNTCLNLGSEEQTKKYIKKEEKKALGR